MPQKHLMIDVIKLKIIELINWVYELIVRADIHKECEYTHNMGFVWEIGSFTWSGAGKANKAPPMPLNRR